jgi:hypothetical protein
MGLIRADVGSARHRDPLHGGNRTVIRMVYTTAMQVRSFIES